MSESTLIQKFLIKNFPTHRLKHNMRFKRIIIIDNKRYLLSNDEARKALYFKLLDTVTYLFAFEKEQIEPVLKGFLNMK